MPGMRRYLKVLPIVLLLSTMLVPAGARADDPLVYQNGTASLSISETDVFLRSNGMERHWNRDTLNERAFYITAGTAMSNEPWPDFALQLGGATVTSSAMTLTGVRGEVIGDGVRVTFDVEIPGALQVTRIVEAYDGVGVLESRTVVRPVVPLTLSGYSLDEIHLTSIQTEATAHAFRAGADWRYDEGWDPVNIGDDHRGRWRESTTGSAIYANGEWLDVNSLREDGSTLRTLTMVMERRNAASSIAATTRGIFRVGVDFSRDIVYGGPFEDAIHAENPAPPLPEQHVESSARTPQPSARARALVPGRPLELERVATTIGADADANAWEYYKYLTRARLTPYPKAVTFNTNGVDSNAISTGAKDDVDFARLQTLAEAARAMGVETFILDDGWQARSGDWCPDSPQCPEPRWDGQDQRFAPRFPDDEFRAVREVLAGDPDDPSDDMALGLWMTPMEFHPSSGAFQRNPQWACAPVGHATGAASYADDGGSFDAGIGVWNPVALGTHPDTGEPMRFSRYQEERIRRAIEVYGARYFKFDFLAWVDCAGAEPTDMYGYHDEFVAMLDRLQRSYPDVTFSIDETNDYRLFPFESVARGPSWFQNGKPSTSQLLHNIWNLAPYVPGFSLGQHAASNNTERAQKGVDAVMAVALGSHITFWNAIDTQITPAERAQIKRWTDFYKAHRDTIATFTFPLLEDPLDDGWTALQPWNHDEQSGWLLAYRQGDPDDTATIPLRGIMPGNSYALTLHDPADGSVTSLGMRTAEQLRTGLEVTIDAQHGYALIRIEQV